MFQYDDEDLQFLSDEDRRKALGLDDDEPRFVDEIPDDISDIPFNQPGPVSGSALQVAQPPAPGWVEIRVADVARSRGVVNGKGRYRGHVSMTALARGTNLATSTLIPLLRKDPDIRLLHVDTISRICHFLKCSPGDILRYHEGPRPAVLKK